MTASPVTAAGWIAYEKSGRIAFGQLASQSAKMARLINGDKVPLRRVWLADLPEITDDIQAESAKRASTLSAEMIWRAAKGEELSLLDLSAALVAELGGENDTIWNMAVLQVVLEQPFYFRRQNGRLMPQPEELLNKIADSRQQREQQQLAEQTLIKTLAAGDIPSELLAQADDLLYSPDKNSSLYRALRVHNGASPVAIARFFIAAGVLPDACAYWRGMFHRSWPAAAADDGCALPAALPACSALAFSIDDAGTVEIDDAFSVEELPNGEWRVGVHIAAPALSAAALKVSRERLISVYFPDEKVFMMPPSYIAAYSLAVGELRPALSLYLYYVPKSGDWRIGETVVESVQLSATLSPPQVDEGDMPADAAAAYQKLQTVTSAMEVELPETKRQGDFDDFKITATEPFVSRRLRSGSSAVVAALMRTVNSVWAKQLTSAKAGGLYRIDGGTRTFAPPGREPYMWFSSPLRRFVDLANQRLLLAQLGNVPSPEENWRSLGTAFDRRHTGARRFQQIMERHWSLRAIAAAGDELLAARHLGKGRVRLLDYPLQGHCEGTLPPPNTNLNIWVQDIDFIEQRLTMRPA